MLKGLYYPQTVSWSEQFLNFWRYAQEEAAKDGKVLFYETIWGEPKFIDNFEVFDLQCWVVPQEMDEEFTQLWEDNAMSLYDDFIDLNHIVTLTGDGFKYLDMKSYIFAHEDEFLSPHIVNFR